MSEHKEHFFDAGLRKELDPAPELARKLIEAQEIIGRQKGEMEDLLWQLAEAQERVTQLEEAARELLTVADLRGDSQLPNPCDDALLWTARAQDAWDGLRAALEGK